MPREGTHLSVLGRFSKVGSTERIFWLEIKGGGNKVSPQFVSLAKVGEK